MSELDYPCPPCQDAITAGLTGYYTFLTELTVGVRDQLIAQVPATISLAEFNARIAAFNEYSDAITKTLLETIQILSCDKRLKSCCVVTIPAIIGIAQQFQTRLANLILNQNNPTDYFSNPATAASAKKEAADVARDFAEAAKGYLSALLCKKPCKPCERSRERERSCEKSRSCEREKWYEVVPVVPKRRHCKEKKHERSERDW